MTARDFGEALVLGIETSCDETAAAVVRGGREALSNVIASQHDLHAEYRGVVPEIASRAHAERITPIVKRALSDAGVGLPDIAAVAVGNRPGLIGSLLVGVSAAKALAWSMGKPVVGVDHVQCHLIAGLLHRAGSSPTAEAAFPALGLVVSGGHTSLYLVREGFDLQRLGGTIDDAMGEAYDKVAAMLSLPFPGGPVVDRLARGGDDRRFALPVSRGGDKDALNFSFSGLKTAVLYTVRGVPGAREAKPLEMNEASVADVCASFQRAACEAVIRKLSLAHERNPQCRALFTGGGVTANSRLREELLAWGRKRGVDVRLPAMEFCLDNAAMVAAMGHDTLAARGWAGDALTLTARA